MISIKNNYHRNIKVLLISPPWRLASWPSTAIAQLKSYLATNEISVNSWHLHLEIACKLGLERYDEISMGWDVGEGLYSSLIYPEESERIKAELIEKCLIDGQKSMADWIRTTAREEVASITKDCLESVDFSQYQIVGFSIGAIQTMSSLYLAKMIKKTNPHLNIIFGGSGIIGEVGKTLISLYPFIDYLVDGEGEAALLDLIRYFKFGDQQDLSSINNLWYREPIDGIKKTSQHVIQNLDQLPSPDYSEYFDLASRLSFPSNKIVLPVEASRGCAWEHRCQTNSSELSGCTFCGLYRNSPNYREKSFERLKEEIDHLVTEYKNLKLSFVDAYLPENYKIKLLEYLRMMPADVDLFCELRCDLDDEFGYLLSSIPARKIQIGVESFHPDILKIMEKGRRLVDNVNSIKICQEYGLPFQYNLMVDYPGINRSSILEMADILPLLFGCIPPSECSFYLDRGSRIYMHPELFGIDPDYLDQISHSFLPDALKGVPITQVVTYQEIKEDNDVKLAWQKIKSLIKTWNKIHKKALDHGMKSALTFRYGGKFMIIDDLRDQGFKHYKIEGILKDTLLACQRKTTKNELFHRLKLRSEANLEQVLSVLGKLKLILFDGRFVISLPVLYKTRREIFQLDNDEIV